MSNILHSHSISISLCVTAKSRQQHDNTSILKNKLTGLQYPEHTNTWLQNGWKRVNVNGHANTVHEYQTNIKMKNKLEWGISAVLFGYYIIVHIHFPAQPTVLQVGYFKVLHATCKRRQAHIWAEISVFSLWEIVIIALFQPWHAALMTSDVLSF